MDPSSFSLNTSIGSFKLTPDPDCMMVYVNNSRPGSRTTPVQPEQIPSWCFDPETIWFYFEAPETENKVSAGEKIKTRLLEEITEF